MQGESWKLPLTDNHQREFETLLHGFPVHLVGEIGKSDISVRLFDGLLVLRRVVGLDGGRRRGRHFIALVSAAVFRRGIDTNRARVELTFRGGGRRKESLPCGAALRELLEEREEQKDERSTSLKKLVEMKSAVVLGTNSALVKLYCAGDNLG